MLAKNIIVVVVALSSLGCKQQDTTPVKASANMVVRPAPTPAEWQSALASTYTESQKKDNEDGTVNFMAIFKTTVKKINMVAFGERDAFRKLRIFKVGFPMRLKTSVKSYISVVDNQSPVLFIQPYFWGENGWLFMNKISIMVDGEVVLEHSCGKVQRDTEGVGVAELCDFIASKEEINSLRKITDTSSVVVRLSGEKGYINLERKQKFNATDEFKRDIQSAIAVYDVIGAAIKDHIPPKTSL